MDASLRTQYLARLKQPENTPYASMDVVYKGKTVKMPVYDIPLDYLIFNKYNGRIASSVKSYERQYGVLNPESEDDVKKIESLLWTSHEGRNKRTLEDIGRHGQLKYGIVTRDGVIVDGNRRAMLLRRLAKKQSKGTAYFKGVILDENLNDNPREIMRLETSYQMGEDDKLDYNPIEKYLKSYDLKHEYDFTEREIGTMMGEKEEQIRSYLGIMGLMNEYLHDLGYDGIYTRLDGTEGPFVDVHGYLKQYIGRNGEYASTRVSWKYRKEDVEELKAIYFDYIRARYSTQEKDYRLIGKPSNRGRNSFFGNEILWKEFKDRHWDGASQIKEPSIDECRNRYPTQNLDEILKARDDDWTKAVKGTLKGNIGRTRRRLEDFNEREQPKELLNRAYSALQAIDMESKAFLMDSEVETLVKEINGLTYQMQKAIKRA